MQIIVNAEPREIRAETLDAALQELGLTSPAIATALNGQFVSRAKRVDTTLSDGDRLEVLAPMQGG
ncbi:sulfur carrier protein ThiS [Phaeobacter sp. QD34_3]|uniref:sulfur carrier protein ThiS n=1 Tax=unclassified Phaeobacter TaxID=2621772 RepID=UPI00237FCA47|nr:MULTISPECIES: sulfur carrier protein ThiS [unclassified Phaeobacter]MDE4133749.1 sulfur carrier protein ThiS [Phaeobacter sp. QD34_3]MDE4137318.1 sulfur carrier protein ThiS [Phaeobacter sp. QD34_24]